MSTVVNLMGAPGAGKSILSYDLCSLLRKQYHRAELVTEAAKDHIYDGKRSEELDPLEVLAEQNRRVKRLVGKTDLIVTDSPLYLSAFYANKFGYNKSFEQYVIDLANSYPSINFFVKRNHTYDPAGRSQNEEESNEIHSELISFLDSYDIKYHAVLAGDGLAKTVATILKGEGAIK